MQNKGASFFVSLLVIVSCTLVASPLLVDAQGSGGLGNITSGSSSGGAGGITNPLDGVDSITDVLRKIINWMLGLVAFIALIAIVTSGGRMIFGFLDEGQIKRAKTTILWAVIGLAVVILSYTIINIVAVEILGAGSSGSYNGGSGTPPNQLPRP